MIRPKPTGLGLFFPLAALLFFGCDGIHTGTDPGEWQAVFDTVGDTITVRTVAGSVWGDTAALEPEVSIGGLEGADEYVFGQPHAIAVAPDGVMFVLDTQVPILRAYSPDGTHLRDVGREGDGPGEYRSPDGVAVLPDGRILVRDPPNSRIAVFSALGEYLNQWHLSGGFNTDRRFYVDASGNSYVTALLERGVGPWDWRFGLIRYSPQGSIMDTVQAPTWAYDYPQVTASRENSRSVRRVPFSASVAWSFSSQGYMVGGLSTQYRIGLFRSEGPILRVERDWAPIPVLPEEAHEQRRRITVGFQRQYGGWRWNGPGVPSTKAPFKEVFVSWEGDIWVLRATQGVPVMSPEEAREQEEASGRVPLRFQEPAAFDVFAADGRFMGPVRVPESLRVEPEPIIRGDHLWAIVRDDWDVPSLVRFEIIRP
jgi:hypothetical protein